MPLCPKCEGYFPGNGNWKWCESHQKEYDEWLSTTYIPESSCKCGGQYYVNGELQMTNPPTYPLMQIYRCKDCNEIRLTHARDGKVRIMVRELDD